jgi:hypothetical protein
MPAVPEHTIVDSIIDLWPLAASAVAAVVGWFTAVLKGRNDFKNKAEAAFTELLERAHKTEIELGQMRAVLAAATGKKFEEVTLEMIRDLVFKQAVTLREIQSFIYTMPRLVWIKRREGEKSFRMIQVSQAYADKYLGGEAQTYEGKFDHDIWPVDVADAFVANDELAYRSGETVETVEKIYSSRTNIHGVFIGTKWSFRLGNDTYVCGLGVHEDVHIPKDIDVTAF